MKKQQPYLPFYVGDFWASVADWKGDAATLYLGLLTHQWSLGSLPADPEAICLLMRYSPESFAALWPKVSTKFVERDGRLINERLEYHRIKAEEKSKQNAKSGKKGGLASKKARGGGRSSGGGTGGGANATANANANAIADAEKALVALRLENASSENEANATANATDSLHHPNLIQSKPSLRVLSGGEVG